MIDQQKSDILLKLVIVISILSYSLWPYFNNLPFELFYTGVALSHFLLALYIKQVTKKSFITFFLFCVTLNNLLDELLFDPQKIGYNEYIATAIIIVVYLLKDKDPKSDA
jgi:hypothetical protein